jgi:hypothetical protein
MMLFSSRSSAAASSSVISSVMDAGYRVAMKTMTNTEAIAVRLQKTCMAQKQCRQKTSIQAMTIPALPIIT